MKKNSGFRLFGLIPLSSNDSGVDLKKWAVTAIFGIILIRLMTEFIAIPFRFEELLFFRGGIWDPIKSLWWFYLIGFVINFLKMISTINSPEVQDSAPAIPVRGFFVSLNAGLLEEIIFRWVLLYFFMGVLFILNLVLMAVFDWSFLYDLSSSWMSGFGELMLGGTGLNIEGTWTIPLAIFLSNHKFQQGHQYQGLVGVIFSAFGGLVFFWTTFHFGLFAAMWAHFLFDIMVFMMLFIDVLIEKTLGLKNAKNRAYKWYSPKPNY